MAWRLTGLLRALAAAEHPALDDLVGATGMARGRVGTAMATLMSRGLVRSVGRGRYALTAAGRQVVTSGKEIRSGPRGLHTGVRRPAQDTLRARLWRALRLKRKASLPELLTLAARGSERAAERNAWMYLRALHSAGYIQKLPSRAPGTHPNSRGHIKWLVIRDTGPRAPIVRRRHREMVDPNTGERFPLGEDWRP